MVLNPIFRINTVKYISFKNKVQRTNIRALNCGRVLELNECLVQIVMILGNKENIFYKLATIKTHYCE